MADDRGARTGETLLLGSIAGHSSAPASEPAELDIGRARYRELEVVGEGGLGTVLRAHDEVLGRDVALKRIGPRARETTAIHERFLREARITARLDHPGIVPVHDAGVTDDGRMFYTMRLIRGRSLAEVAASATTLDARLRLVGALTAACHAVGYAHREGVIHRDLKPTNIMIGPLGETQVVDWGLAEVLTERTATAGFAGTLAYASPELVRGEPATLGSDVWALGVTLHEAITGTHRFELTRGELETILAQPTLEPARWPTDCPPELAAIGDRAMAREPADRYADAHAMALDLEAFRDGRRVAAHRYSPGELLRRFLRAWRWPLVAVGTMVIGTIVALATTAYRTERQRERAVAAELATAEQLARAELALAEALAKDAAASLQVGAIARAERSAAEALLHGEHPEARGVLAAVHAAPRPRASRHVELASCRHVAAISSSTAACLAGEQLELWHLPVDGSPQRRWTQPLAAVGAVGLGEHWIVAWQADATLRVLEVSTGREHARTRALAKIVDVEVSYPKDRVIAHDGRKVLAFGSDGSAREEAVCDGRGVAAAATTDRETFVVCRGGELGRFGVTGYAALEATPFGAELPPATTLALSETGFDLAIGNAAGDVQVHDLRGCFMPGCEVPRPYLLTRVLTTPIRKLACLGPDVIAIGDRGDAAHIGRHAIGELTRLPITADRPIVFLEGGEVVVGGDAFHAWTIDGAARPSTLRTSARLVAAAVSEQQLVAITEEGRQVRWNATTGERESGAGAATAAAFGRDGQLVVATPAELIVHDAAGAVRERVAQPGAGRVGFRGSAWLAIGDGWVRRAGEEPVVVPRAIVTAIAAGDAWLVDAELAIWRVDARATMHGRAIGSSALAVSSDGARVATADRHRVQLGSWEIPIEDGEVTALALDDAGATLAVATSRGVVEIWDTATRRLAARMTNLDQRARWLELRGGTLWAAGDDGALRRWDLGQLRRPARELVAAARAMWGAR